MHQGQQVTRALASLEGLGWLCLPWNHTCGFFDPATTFVSPEGNRVAWRPASREHAPGAAGGIPRRSDYRGGAQEGGACNQGMNSMFTPTESPRPSALRSGS